ncbi:thiamine pyrophosphate-requiring protein [Pseudooceanicola sp. CBS1P-1]|uniref:Thiamine pyrophosphate-requiring protein n=1 Tax=Pseudooceanicola albus TaxID=2692189 RepID=A0A6L7G5I7_9RHOB|nr:MULTISPECIES: thiamine pyrophosphate-requiring protein [Pseudooceanicola]MBT9385088.1 thiamine pyrophosphate-requiring protein [Pseudooceanicola endophyticus]MXN18620.1 thiamine pyrophosphate-requiring protein [Pseudooceanicola albus]
MRDQDNPPGLSAGGAIFGTLKALGVDYVFANSGTDFPPVIEGLATARQQELPLPQAITVPHEMAAVSMAHGYFQISGRAQAVMLHTNVGLSNGATGAINASCDHIPMLLMSGRTPVTEEGRFGARTVPIGWGQEMYDQTALVREATKWDYELRFPEQLPDLFDRALAIARSTPAGPVYLSLPREVLCAPVDPATLGHPARMTPALTAPPPEALARAAALLAGAQTPLIISQRGAGSARAFEALSAFIDDWAIPLSHYWANQISVPMTHPMQMGTDPEALLAEADVVLVINSLAPWSPDRVRLRDDAKVIHLGPDPLFSRTPVRNFRADLTLPGETAPTLLALIAAMQAHPRDRARIAQRHTRIRALSEARRTDVIARAEVGCRAPMTKDWVSLCLSRALKGRPATVYHELGCPLEPLSPDQHMGYVQEPHSGGLGWGFPAALGAQLADPERLVIATMGDGSYMFANPTVCHQLAEALALPVVVLVLNNGEWGAVRSSVEGLYPGGAAMRANAVPLTALTPSPDFARVAEASRAWSETVTEGAALPAALERAIDIATRERRQVLLNIAIAPTQA